MKNKFTTILIDDEALSMAVIADYLKAFPEIEIIGKYAKSRTAVEKILTLKPDLLFLDIHMPVMDGFGLIEAIVEKHDPYIIFTTAFQDYAIKAFEVNAIGYLLKPFTKEKFNLSVNKFLSFMKEPVEERYETLLRLLQQENGSKDVLEKVMIRDTKKIYYLPVKEILYFEASGDYVKAICADKQHLISYSLTGLEDKLPAKQFVRVHKSYIINAEQVKEFLPYSNGEYHIVMSNKEVIKSGRHYRDHLSKLFKGL